MSQENVSNKIQSITLYSQLSSQQRKITFFPTIINRRTQYNTFYNLKPNDRGRIGNYNDIWMQTKRFQPPGDTVED